MDADAPLEETCQLESRHWRIRDAADPERVEMVDDSGVIGLYPLLKPGGCY